MDINDKDNRGTSPLHWACFSKSEFALSYILALNPDLETVDFQGQTALHLAIRSVGDLKSTRPVRALLLKGASRAAKTKKDETCKQLIKSDVSDTMRKELDQMLIEPNYIECFMVKTPLVPLRQNHKTQTLFVSLFLVIIFTQLFIIIPSKLNFLTQIQTKKQLFLPTLFHCFQSFWLYHFSQQAYLILAI